MMEEALAGVDTLVEEKSQEYLSRWNRLVSTTNWEKGRIICQWRDGLIEAGAPATACTDDAWSRQVGNVTPQHVGRLRRVYQRFGQQHEQFSGLFWSHFHMALEWPDAEMYLEGAVSNRWSVAEMRQQRWEAMGGPAEDALQDGEIAAAEADEDSPAEASDAMAQEVSPSQGEVHDPQAATEFDPSYDGAEPAEAADRDLTAEEAPFDAEATAPVRPFENLGQLPSDLNDAFESFKLAILHHKIDGWREVACGEVLAALDSLKQLALAPAE